MMPARLKQSNFRPFQGAFLLLALASLSALAQTALSPSKPVLSPASGLYRIAGTVIDAVTDEPVRRATISALAMDDSHAVAATETDHEGHFSLEGLPAGKFQLTASRRGFRTAFYDEHEEFSTAIVTGKGQETGSLTFRLVPGSVLRGAVTDDGGDPVQGADVMLFLKPHGQNSGGRIQQIESAVTDDTGAYEFANLSAGEYLLAVKAEPWYAMHHSADPSHPTPASDSSAALDVAYPIAFFDSTTDEAAASPIVLAGGERQEANFNLHAVPALRIALEAPKAEGGSSASAAGPSLRQSIFGARFYNQPPAPQSNPGQSAIEFAGVAPGHYALTQGDPPRIVDLDATASQQVDPETGTPTVAVSGALRPSPGLLPAGEVAVILESLDPARRLEPIETICAGSRFNFASVPPGAWELSAVNSGRQLPVAAITISGNATPGNQLTVKDLPLFIVATVAMGKTRVEGFARKPGPSGDRRVPAGRVAGVESGQGVAGAMILLVPKNMAALSSLVRRDQSDSDGSFSLRDVVPGQYTVVAIEDGWKLDWEQPEILARYLPGGIAVTVEDDSGKLLILDKPVPVQAR
jgi:hypothetical protein